MTRSDICDELAVDLCLARLRHLAARHRLQQVDDPGTRAAEAECRAQVDVVLGLLAELKAPRPESSPRPVR